MKSMHQMQSDMLSQCKAGSEYPKPIFHFNGVIQLVFDEEGERRANRQCEIEAMILLYGVIIGVPLAIAIGYFTLP